VEDDIDEEELTDGDEEDGQWRRFGPIVRKADVISDKHYGRVQENDADDENRTEDFREVVHEPEHGLHKSVADVRPREMFVVKQRQERNPQDMHAETTGLPQCRADFG